MSVILILSIYYLALTILAYFWMLHDKQKSKQGTNGKGRIKEKSLLIIAIAGGAIGSLVGMYSLRHKTKHFSFIFTFWFSLLLHIALIGYLFYKHYI